MQQRSSQTHARILDAAQDLFARSGYDATAVADICQAAGVSKGAFYHHFPSKQAVFLELLENWLTELETRFPSVANGAQDLPQTLLQLTQRVQDVFQAADGRLPMFLEFWTQASRDPTVWQASVQPYQRFQAYFAALVQAGVDKGTLKPVDSQAAARVIVAMAVGILLQGLLDPQGADWDRVARSGMQFLLKGLEKE